MFGAAQVMADRACTVSYVKRVLQTHWAAHVFVRTHVGRAARRQKRSYDRALKPRSFNVGDCHDSRCAQRQQEIRSTVGRPILRP